MEYSLVNLKQFVDFKNVTLSHFTNTLNLIGLEVDEIIISDIENNKNIKLILKIPANREDLLNEEILIEEFLTIFLFNIYNLWEIIKKKYMFILKHKYTFYKFGDLVSKSSQIPNLFTYLIEIENFNPNINSRWISKRLNNSSLSVSSPLNNILNFVLSEWGQTVNHFSSQNINNSNYKFECLSEVENFSFGNSKFYELKPGTIVLKNNSNEIFSVIGLIKDSSIDENNSKFLLEATFYDIHENLLNLNTLNTKLSLRYLRRSFPEKFKYALQRLLTLLEIINHSNIKSIQSVISDNVNIIQPYRIIKLNKNFFINFLNIKKYELSIFDKLGFKIICKTPKELYFRVPNSRKDLYRQIDIIEEYSKCIGYDNFKKITPIKTINFKNNRISANKFLKQFLLDHSFNEILTNSIVSESRQLNNTVFLTNPLTAELAILRSSLIPNLIDIFSKNLVTTSNKLRFFEIGRLFKLKNLKLIEEEYLSGIFQLEIPKKYSHEISEWFIHKGFIEHILKILNINEVKFASFSGDIEFYHPSRSSTLIYQNNIIGQIGEIHPSYRKKLNLKSNKTFLFELNLTNLKNQKPRSTIKIYTEYSKYPTITKDLSLIINKSLNILNLKYCIQNNTTNLKAISFFDLYSKDYNLITLGVRLEFQSFSKTLKNDDIELVMQNLITELTNNFDITLLK